MRFLFFALFCLPVLAQAQKPLFVPRNLQKLYDKGTRSTTGEPGPRYWQNRASYTIQASIEPKTHHLTGAATIVYTNNSPDSLKLIRLKLAHDLYRKNGQRNDDVAPEDVDEGVNIRALARDGKDVPEASRRRGNTFLDLQIRERPLAPGASTTLKVEWDYELPTDLAATRECVCDSASFFVAYWYPQVAVYDDAQGWASTPYTGLQEFYNDFSDYDVTISLPRGFQVWATGEWQNMEDVLTRVYRERWQAAHTSNEVTSIFTEKELKTNEVYKRGTQFGFRFVASNVPDFAFAASNHFNWDATSVVADAKTGRRTFVSAVYKSEDEDYPRVARIAADGIGLMSTWLPGYPFPYPSMTVFSGNDGMEYPMMCNDASTSPDFVTSLTVHEVSHTYFPFLMGINEQEYAWMDEGWASFFDFNLADSLTGGKEGGVRGYGSVAGTESDVPPLVRSSNLRGRAYGVASYQRPQAAYLVLYDLLGYKTFHDCMVGYIDRWQGKHPLPQDFFNTWNNLSGQNLDWFWQPWFAEWGYPDVAVARVERTLGLDSETIVIEKRGNLPIPVHLEITYTDGSKQTVHHTAAVWRSGNTDLRVFTQPNKTVKMVQLGNNKTIPDSDKSNDVWKR